MRQWCMYFRKELYNAVGEYFSPDFVLRHRVSSPGRRAPGFCCYGCQVRPGPHSVNNGLRRTQRSAVGISAPRPHYSP